MELFKGRGHVLVALNRITISRKAARAEGEIQVWIMFLDRTLWEFLKRHCSDPWDKSQSGFSPFFANSAFATFRVS
jgi:hypothetical protein